MLQRRRRLCCITKRIWNGRSPFYIHLIGFLCLVLFFPMFLFFNHHGWLQRGPGLKKTSLAYTVKGFRSRKSESNLPRDNLTISVPQTDLSPNGSTGLENTPRAHPSVYDKKRTMPPSANHFKYVINEVTKCLEKRPFLILLITAAPDQVEARQAIRKTWGNEKVVPGIQILRIFLLRISTELDRQLQQSIVAESRQYHDVIQQDYLDTYNNLTIKTLMGMNWVATYCPHVLYVMKTDSDMFVNTEYLTHHLLKPELSPRQEYFTGYLLRGCAPNRNKESKWYMPPELYPGDLYPVFCSGTGYVFSGDLAEKIVEVSLRVRHLPLEDVYVGVCLATLGIDPVAPPNESDFNHWHVSFSSCRYSNLVTSHQFQPGELVEYWNLVQQNKNNAC